MSNANAKQVGGGHYKGTTYQHWDFVMIALAGRYLEGNITKYITRWRKKNGLQDLQKARHYLTKLIEQFNLGNVQPLYTVWRNPLQSPEHFCDVNGVDVSERMVVQLVSNWHGINDLHKAGSILDALIEQVQHAAEQYADEEQRTFTSGGLTGQGDPMMAAHIDARGVVEALAQRPDLVPLPHEATAEMKESVSSIVSGYAAGKIWERMRDTALFGSSPGAGYVNQG